MFRSVVLKSFESTNKNFVVLMDSLDDFQLDIDSVSHSLQGLLKLVGSMNKPRDIVDIRFCCPPAEVYHRFIKISSNPNKDFRRALRASMVSGGTGVDRRAEIEFFPLLFIIRIF